MKPASTPSASERFPLNDSSSGDPSGPSARTQASRGPVTVAAAPASDGASEISTRPPEAIMR